MDEPTAAPPQTIVALARALAELGAGRLGEQLELAEELHGQLGVWIDELRRRRRHWIRGLHQDI